MKIIFLPRQLFVSRKKKRRKELIYPHLSILHPFPPLSLSINLLSNHSPIKQKKDIFSSNTFFTFPETFPNRNETNFDQLILLSPPSKEDKEKKRKREGRKRERERGGRRILGIDVSSRRGWKRERTRVIRKACVRVHTVGAVGSSPS